MSPIRSIQWLVAWVTWLLTGATARWLGAMPDTRQRVYFANHTSHLDFVVLWAALPAAVRCANPAGGRCGLLGEGLAQAVSRPAGLSRGPDRAAIERRRRHPRGHRRLGARRDRNHGAGARRRKLAHPLSRGHARTGGRTRAVQARPLSSLSGVSGTRTRAGVARPTRARSTRREKFCRCRSSPPRLSDCRCGSRRARTVTRSWIAPDKL